jgi:hypothetical protein
MQTKVVMPARIASVEADSNPSANVTSKATGKAMSNSGGLLWNLLGTTIVFLLVLLPISNISKVSSESQIRLTPAEFNVKIGSPEKIDLQLRLSSGVSSAIEFKLSTSEQGAQMLGENKLKVTLVVEGQEILLGEEKTFTLPARSTQVATLSVDPTEATQDFNFELPLILEQKSGATRLTQGQQQVQLKLESRIASQKQERQLDVVIAVGVAVTALILIVLVLFLNRKKEQEESGQEGN